MKRVSVFEEINKTKKDAEHYKKEADEWQKKYSELHKKYKDLEGKYNQLMNSNTPSSKIPIYLKQYSYTRPAKGTRKRGKPKNSNGGYRKKPKKYDERIEATASKCPRCNGSKLKERKEEKYSFPTYDIPEIGIITKESVVHVYECDKCGFVFEGTHPEIPIAGHIGPRLQSYFTVLKHHFGGAYDKISSFSRSVFGDSFCADAINNSIGNVASALEPSYNNIQEKIKEAPVKQSDETGWPVDGKPWWLWVIVTMNYIFLRIDKFRNHAVLEKIFGVAEDFVGVLVSDCFSAYHAFKVVCQKCWYHLLRKAKFEALKHPKTDVVVLSNTLHELYHSMTAFLDGKPDETERIWRAILYKQKLDRLVQMKWKSKEAITIIERIKKYNQQWLVGIIMPEVPLHNNDNERPIRSLSLPRKTCGGHRTEKGARDFAIIASHLQTWRKRGFSQFTELNKFLRDCNAGKKPLI